MSILLSAIYPEGIVFAADKNITNTITLSGGTRKWVEHEGIKVLAWPNHKAIIGYVGLGCLANLDMEEYLRIFIAKTRDFSSIDDLAHQLKDEIQVDFLNDYSYRDISRELLLIHLGGFTVKQDVFVPVHYHIGNSSGNVDSQTGEYPSATRNFYVFEDIEQNFRKWPNPEDYPLKVRNRLQNMINQNHYLWFNNGYNLGAFNVFKKHIWDSLKTIQDAGFAPNRSDLDARIAFCRMSVELFGSFFTYHNYPEDRAVGGGSDAVYILWPEDPSK